MKRQNGKRRFRMLGLLCLLLCALTFAPARNAEAASAKSKALNAYKKFLASNNSIRLSDFAFGSLQDFKFSLVYWDKDSVPELLITYAVKNNASELRSVLYDAGHLYTCKKGKVKYVEELYATSRIKYYKKKGVYYNPAAKMYFKLTAHKTKSYTAQEVRKIIGSRKPTKPKFYKNTAANRKKYLK